MAGDRKARPDQTTANVTETSGAATRRAPSGTVVMGAGVPVVPSVVRRLVRRAEQSEQPDAPLDRERQVLVPRTAKARRHVRTDSSRPLTRQFPVDRSVKETPIAQVIETTSE